MNGFAVAADYQTRCEVGRGSGGGGPFGGGDFEEALLNLLAGAQGEEIDGPDWTVCAAPPLPASSLEHRFGSRLASAVKVEMTSPEDTCWIESVENGWLFLNSGWLLAVGNEAEELLVTSSLVREQIRGIEFVSGRFPASPRMVSPLGGDGWIACGSAAMGFDPLCGDGTAHAVREAILAAAVIRASRNGDVEELLAHYEARLTAGFYRIWACAGSFILPEVRGIGGGGTGGG